MGIVSLSRLLGEVCEGSIGQDGLRFKVQKIQGLPLYAFPIFHKSCSWRRFEKDLKLGYRDLIQIGGFGFEIGETKNWAPSTDCSTTIAKVYFSSSLLSQSSELAFYLSINLSFSHLYIRIDLNHLLLDYKAISFSIYLWNDPCGFTNELTSLDGMRTQ
ncbi:hypothetical protein D8674_041287 [Pyrus ussuriensis x Pyrus communis]|uniref:Uncharacterized protein n=1 Tax=Pyrus ussuriensis x Pyrus communis TaxID=2448454 RepID=A0A5N5G471_9ROSA|nr:hypothetical protein D8674_041287 [Pyrus ussuriensis x Pyrus communis]